MKKLSIYLTTYNRVEYLKSMVKSILDQTFTDFDLYILDNCSTDGTEQFISSICDTRVRYIRHTHKIEPIENLNYAFEQCDSMYFCVFHDDDIVHDSLIEKEINFMEQHLECVAVSCLSNNIDEEGNTIKIRSVKSKDEVKEYSNTGFFENYISYQKSLTFPATMYRTSFVKKNKIALRDSPGPCMDVVLYMDIEKAGGVLAEIQEALFDYRIHLNQDSSINLEKMLIQLIQYLNQDTYYSTLLNKHSSGKERYYRWYSRRLLVRVASGATSNQAAAAYLKKMKTMLDGSDHYYRWIRLVLLLEKAAPDFFNIVYKWVKSKS